MEGGNSGLYSYVPTGWGAQQEGQIDTFSPTSSSATYGQPQYHAETFDESTDEEEEVEVVDTTQASHTPVQGGGHADADASDAPGLKASGDEGWISAEKVEELEKHREHSAAMNSDEDRVVDEAVDDLQVEEKGKEISSSGGSRGEQKYKPSFAITVGDYEKHGEGGMKGYVSYKVNVKTTLVQYKQSEFVVERRYSDFNWLHERLKESYKGCIIPPMPAKAVIQNRFDTAFIETRRRELGKFIKEVTEHPVLCSSDILQTFLESPTEAFDKEKTAKPQTGYTKKMFSWVSTTVTQQLSPAQEIDEWFSKKAAYFLALETKMFDLHKSSRALSEKQNELLLLHYDFSVAATHVSTAEEEEDKDLSKHWTKMSDVSEQIRLVGQEAVANQEVRFEEPLANFLQHVLAAKETMNNRLVALAEFQAAEKRLQAFNEKKSKPGFKTNAAADQSAEQLEKRVEETKEEFEMITSSLRKEIERFEAAKAKDIRRAVREYAKANMDTTLQIADQWKKMLNQIQTSM